MKRMSVTLIGAMLVSILAPTSAHAGGKAAAVRETIEFVVRKLGKEALPEGVAVVSRKLEGLVARHGEEVLVAFRKAGPVAISAIERAGAQGGNVASLLARHGEEAVAVVSSPRRLALVLKHGDEAGEALIRHRALVEPVVESLGQAGARALASLNPQSAHLLARMVEEGSLQKMSRTDRLLEIIGQYGDKAMAFVWRNKGALIITATLAAFLHDPEAFLSGARNLAEVVGRTAVQPVTEGAREAVRQVNWTLIIVWVLSLGGVFLTLRLWRKGSR